MASRSLTLLLLASQEVAGWQLTGMPAPRQSRSSTPMMKRPPPNIFDKPLFKGLVGVIYKCSRLTADVGSARHRAAA